MSIDIKDPKIQITFGLIFLGLIIAGLFFKFSYQPTKKRIQALSAQEANLSQELEQVRAAVAKLPELEANFKILEKRWLKAQELLPTDKELPSLLKKVTNAGIEAGVRFLVFKPGKPISATQLSSTIPISISVVGNFGQVTTFMANLGNLSRIIIASNIKINPNNDPIRTVKADFEANAYVFKSGGEQASAKVQTSRRAR
jgi:type IV pilus assembly protein PilO